MKIHIENSRCVGLAIPKDFHTHRMESSQLHIPPVLFAILEESDDFIQSTSLVTLSQLT